MGSSCGTSENSIEELWDRFTSPQLKQDKTKDTAAHICKNVETWSQCQHEEHRSTSTFSSLLMSWAEQHGWEPHSTVLPTTLLQPQAPPVGEVPHAQCTPWEPFKIRTEGLIHREKATKPPTELPSTHKHLCRQAMCGTSAWKNIVFQPSGR